MRTIVTGAKPGGGNPMEKQSLAPAVQELWNTWEIHSLILISLFLQVFLFLFADFRRRKVSTILSMMLWLAIYVLGHLAVRASQPGHQLMSFWAPFVLVHLGGQDTITALSMQDNVLWMRHRLNLVTQVTVAGYVVGKASWPDHRLKVAMILVFVSGCIKYGERTFYLFYARPKILTSTFTWNLYGHGGAPYKDMRARAKELMMETLSRMTRGSSSVPSRPWMETFVVITDIMAGDSPLNKVWTITLADTGNLPDMLAEFLSHGERQSAYEYVGALLAHCYGRLYTKAYARDYYLFRYSWVFRSIAAAVHRVICFVLPTLFPYVATPIALVLFAASDKWGPLPSASNRADIIVSYILLVGAILLDVSSIAKFIFSRFSTSFNPSSRHKKQWSEQLGQYNLINSAQANKLWVLCGLDVKHTPITTPTKEFILDSLLSSGTRKEWNIASTRGQLALHKWTTLKALEESIGSGFDFRISVLTWHIATYMCFYHGDEDNITNSDGVKKRMEISGELSNYIMYLVFKCGVMLTTSFLVVHDNACREIGKFISRSGQVNRGGKDGAIMRLFSEEITVDDSETIKVEQEEIIKVGRGESREQYETIKVDKHEESKEQDDIQIEHEESPNNCSHGVADDHIKKLRHSAEALYSPLVLRQASKVAQELISIKDEAERWDLIAAVWAEMLYYTAPRCGAAFHCEHLVTGGEFITHVLVLMYLLGPFLPRHGV